MKELIDRVRYDRMNLAELREAVEKLVAERDQLKQDLAAELQGHLQIRETLGARDTETMFAFAERFAKERDALTQKLEDCAIRNAMLAPFGRRVDELLKERDALKADAERLDYMEKHLLRKATMRFDPTHFKEVNAWTIASHGTNLRKAIDAAMKEQQK